MPRKSEPDAAPPDKPSHPRERSRSLQTQKEKQTAKTVPKKGHSSKSVLLYKVKFLFTVVVL